MQTRSYKKVRAGFTVIEVTLVMAFVAVLILAVVSVTVYAGKIYAKGVTLKTLNQVGREVSDMLRRDITQVDPSRVQYVTTGTPVMTGRLCLGSVSYIWNTPAALTSGPSAKITTSTGVAVHLSRVQDAGARFCTQSGAGAYPTQITPAEQHTELLIGADSDFVVYNLVSNRYYSSSTSPSQGMYGISMTIGTNEAGTLDTSAVGAPACKVPSDSAANFEFCSVREFSMIVRAGGNTQ